VSDVRDTFEQDARDEVLRRVGFDPHERSAMRGRNNFALLFACVLRLARRLDALEGREVTSESPE